MSENQKEVLFHHITVKGTAYEVGRKQAEYLQKLYPEVLHFMFNGNEWIKPASKKAIRKTMKVFEQFCPNINQEIQGFADALGHSPEEVIFYTFSHVNQGNCSQFSALSNQTEDNNIYVGRSYEWSEDDDKKLMTTKVDGSYGHMGFSLITFGRYDGINEKGLCVTMTNGIPGMMSEEPGLRFWMVIRILLDQCKNVEEAIRLIELLPISSYCNLLITDQNDKSVLVEINNDVKVFKHISAASKDGYVCSTNHYTLPEMKELTRNKMQQSVDRYDAIMNTLCGRTVSSNAMKTLLSTQMPRGLACHFYQDGLGTLWSILFNVTNLKAEICFGSPVVNQWITFDLNTEEGVQAYMAVLPFEDSTPDTWKHV